MKKFIFLLILSLFWNCTSSKVATRFSDLSTPHGKPDTFQSTTNLGLNFLILVFEIVDKASLEETVKDFTDEARKGKATSHIIVDASCIPWWFILPPFSIVLTPVSCTVSGYTYK